MVTTSSPTGYSLQPGVAATDRVTVTNPAGGAATGTVTFFLCGPTQVTAGGCPSGGTQIGAVKTLNGSGVAISDVTTATTAIGTYCWRAEYTPTGASVGVLSSGQHTNATTECFTVGLPGPPQAGRAADPTDHSQPVGATLLLGLFGVGLLTRAVRRPKSSR
jgi:hypothetical protein